jgi:NADPH:quinone reductase-like Zn-dependent oxidoreductase
MSETQQRGSLDGGSLGRSPAGSAASERTAARPRQANAAAWLRERGGAFEIGPAPYTSPRENEITVKNHAVAVNPLDWGIQKAGSFLYRWLKYPAVLGTDVAGEVVETGPGVTRFKAGDRVLGHAVGVERDHNNPAEGAFQDYTVLQANMAATIPASMPFEDAAVLPLGLSTAACALFGKDCLALNHPSLSSRPTGETVLVWGGSTSVGSNAIQLAAAAGYEVITTCSPKNFGYVARLGASHAFDYHSPTVTDDIISALKGGKLAGALAIGAGSHRPCTDILRACEGAKTLVFASPPGGSLDGLLQQRPSGARLFRGFLASGRSTVALMMRARRQGIRAKFVNGATLRANEVSKAVYEDYLPAALAAGTYQAAPGPRVIGRGLRHIQAALDAQLRGVSAEKIVVSLDSGPASGR